MPVENGIKGENEEDFVQLITACSPHSGTDGKDSFKPHQRFKPHQSEPRENYTTAQAHVRNSLSSQSGRVDSFRPPHYTTVLARLKNSLSSHSGKDREVSFSPRQNESAHNYKTVQAHITNSLCSQSGRVDSFRPPHYTTVLARLKNSLSTHSGKDSEVSFSPRQNEPGHNYKTVQAHIKNSLSSYCVEPNRQAVDVDNRHSIGRSTEQSTTRTTSGQSSSSFTLPHANVSELTGAPNTHSVVNKDSVAGASSSQGSARTDDGENICRKLPEMPSSAVTRKKYQCKECGFSFVTPHKLASHERIHTGEKPFSCSFCDMKFRTKYPLKMHELHHNNELPQCDLCGGRFVHLRAHMRTHSATSYKHACSVCQKRFLNSAKLREHMVTHTDERRFTCQDCGGRYRTRTHLKRHMAVHTKEKNHVCNICGTKFLQRAGLNQHIRVHTGEKPFPCEMCGRSFRLTSMLANHQRTHTNEKPFVCSTCGKAFRMPTALSRHELIHSGVQPYECSLCGMRFNQSNSMKRHMLTHTGEQPYSCSDCGQRFTQSGGLASHRRRHCPTKQHTDVSEGDCEGAE